MAKPTSSTSDETMREAKSAAADLGESAREAAQDAADTVRDEATRRADSARSGVADNVSDVASALRKAADDMREDSAQERIFGQIAGGLADVSETIRDKDLGEVAGELSSFARHNPMLFLGGAALAGFAATRFASASARHDGGPRHRPAQTATSLHQGRSASGAAADFRPAPSTQGTTGGTS